VLCSVLHEEVMSVIRKGCKYKGRKTVQIVVLCYEMYLYWKSGVDTSFFVSKGNNWKVGVGFSAVWGGLGRGLRGL
jgi:hypothetical protein